MGTMNIQATGFTTFPVAVIKSYSIFSDADMQKILAWVKANYGTLIQQMFNPSNTPGFTPSNSQVFQAWVQAWVNYSISSQRASATPAPVPPPPVVIGP